MIIVWAIAIFAALATFGGYKQSRTTSGAVALWYSGNTILCALVCAVAVAILVLA